MLVTLRVLRAKGWLLFCELVHDKSGQKQKFKEVKSNSIVKFK